MKWKKAFLVGGGEGGKIILLNQLFQFLRPFFALHSCMKFWKVNWPSSGSIDSFLATLRDSGLVGFSSACITKI